MPTFRHGKNTSFKIDNSGGTPTDISDTLNSVSFPRDAEVVETTSFGSNDRTYIVGFKNGTFSIEGTYDAATDAVLAGILGADEGTFEYGPEGTAAGRIKYSGEAILTSYEVSGSVGDAVAFTGTFQVSGAVTRGTF
jgi:hypothetical protein